MLLEELLMPRFFAFTLILLRISGLMLAAPVFSNSTVPVNIRILFTLTLSIMIAPLLLANGTAVALPASVLDYVWIAAGELGLGLALGLGVMTILSGLQMGGQLIDQQAGTGLGEVLNPDLDTSGTLVGMLVFLMGTTIFLLLEPWGGHLLMLSALLDTFQTFPLGGAYVPVSTIEFLRDLIHHSLVLGIQIAAPVIAALMMVELALGFLSRTVPQVNVLVVGFAIRGLVGMLIMIVAFSGLGEFVADRVSMTIDGITQSFEPSG
ncbi:MAG: flagellar biosynthetic protein FliR [Planctomycetota bacterium]|nr:flagellar biosynthetic protein FliR [Planctomycetota bacterium]MDA1211081.1 flagellar biosynthetic protein FliR [Planctomycetota bacterium]